MAHKEVQSDASAPGSDNEDTEQNDTAQLLEGIDASETAVELMHSRLSSIAELNLAQFANLEYLGLRQNFVVDMTPLAELSPTLRELDMYDNRIKHIDGLEPLTQLRSVDLSFNKIHTIEKLEPLEQLNELFLVSN
ncbi:protein phosphatase regulatory subunit Sds22, partial [Coemansia sp. RSA 1250]